MPKIKIEKVISFSSEDPDYGAANLLDHKSAKKWQCLKPGERTANVVLQLEEPTVITNVDIGNNHSAYVSVEVGRSSNPNVFQSLIPASLFMTILESRQNVGVHKVRMFKVDDLKKPECEEKWDLVKVICNQHFNNSIKFGISFITLHGSQQAAPKAVQSSRLVVRELSPEIGNLFISEKDTGDKKVSAAVAIRASSSSSSTTTQISAVKKTPLIKRKHTPWGDVDDSPRHKNRNEVLYDDEDYEPNKKIDRIMELKNKENEQKAKQSIDAKEKPKKRKEEEKVKVKTPKRKLDDAGSFKQKRSKLAKPFNRLLEGVEIVISGIQNPERAQLRSAALSMGAKYSADWRNSSTHLICAFANTPKFNQVKGKGKIVMKTWISQCNQQRKRLPWRRFALDPSDQTGNESEEEIEELQPEPAPPQEDENEDEGDDTGGDTDEEIERIKRRKAESQVMDVEASAVAAPPVRDDTPSAKDDAVETCRTSVVAEDREDEQFTDLTHTDLSDYYDGLAFYVDEDFIEDDLTRQLNQYITAYDGEVTTDEDRANYIITNNSKRRQRRRSSREEKIPQVYPDWVFWCHNHQRIMPYEDFLTN
ncbi:PREDICTED: DNA repair protein XRCC1 [Nicrophorus vespilloides]|uniref:DNA repair protein XRCC1 n=1 Tax=Nicrophorus vespilloides TaxID=110193 RepID=A0ABM1M563_NICVS|nr:PREDICTED: DNA repair protein XRCC1 [Nicrophorus vespilloides]